jgi:WD40 repeat protein
MKLSGHLTTCNFVEVSTEEEDMHMMITGSGDTNVKVWDLRSGKASHTFKNHSKAVNCAKFSPDGNWVASGGADGNTYITDIRTEKVVH